MRVRLAFHEMNVGGGDVISCPFNLSVGGVRRCSIERGEILTRRACFTAGKNVGETSPRPRSRRKLLA